MNRDITFLTQDEARALFDPMFLTAYRHGLRKFGGS